MYSKENIEKLLNETSELLYDNESLDESIITVDDIDMELLFEDAGAIGIIAMLAAYFGILVGIPLIASKIERKKLAKGALAISVEEYNVVIEYLMSLRKDIEKIFKNSEYKEYINKKVIHIAKDLPKLDVTNLPFNKNGAFYSLYRLFSVDVVALAKESGKYDKVTITNERLNDYLKKESEKIARIIDKVKVLCNKNEFVKENFTLVGQWNDNKTVFNCMLYAGKNFVLSTSKYLKKK